MCLHRMGMICALSSPNPPTGGHVPPPHGDDLRRLRGPQGGSEAAAGVDDCQEKVWVMGDLQSMLDHVGPV